MNTSDEYKKLSEILKTNNVFLTGKAGTGKSYLTRELIANTKNTVVLASTGLAAANIGGHTVHSFFGLGICKSIDELKNMDAANLQRLESRYGLFKAQIYFMSDLRKNLGLANLIVIDEISMLSAEILDLVIYRIKQYAKREIPMLVVGDFYQLPPVGGAYAFYSENWKFQTIELQKIRRTNNIEFAEKQSEIRTGKKSDIHLYIESKLKNKVELPLKIFSTNKQVQIENEMHLDSINGELFTAQSKENGDPRIVKSFYNELRIEEFFRFKVGARIMFTVNIPKDVIYNGLLGRIVSYANGTITVITDNQEEIKVSPYPFIKSVIESVGSELILKEIARITQYPIVIAAALTIHKSQGLSIDKLEIDCDKIFETGQFYVAVSRAINPDNVNIISFDERYVLENKKVDEFYKNKKAIIL